MTTKNPIGQKKIVRNILRGLLILIIVIVLIIGVLFFQVERAGVQKNLKKSDAAIVLGSAVWEGGRPSPSMQARVKKAVDLYDQKLVKKIIVSGGVGRIPPAEAIVMAELAESLGVNKEDIILEKQATSTRENIHYSYLIGEEQAYNTYIIVSDAFHLKRAALMAKELGVDYQTSPALESPLYTNKVLKFKYTLRETFALIKFYLVKD